MRRNILMSTILSIVMILTVLSPAVANGRWDSQVTGGVTASAGVVFDLDVSSRTDGDTVKGQIQYTREAQGSTAALSMHATVECVYVDASTGNVAIRGPVNVQDGSWGSFVTVEIRADGAAVRVHDGSGTNCGYTGSFPGAVQEGSFNFH